MIVSGSAKSGHIPENKKGDAHLKEPFNPAPMEKGPGSSPYNGMDGDCNGTPTDKSVGGAVGG